MGNRLPPSNSNGNGDITGDRSGYVPAPEKPKRSFCWSCRAQIDNPSQGISLTGAVDAWEVCCDCWEQVPVSQRILLVQKIRQGNDIAQTLDSANALFRVIAAEYHHRSDADQGLTEN